MSPPRRTASSAGDAGGRESLSRVGFGLIVLHGRLAGAQPVGRRGGPVADDTGDLDVLNRTRAAAQREAIDDLSREAALRAVDGEDGGCLSVCFGSMHGAVAPVMVVALP